MQEKSQLFFDYFQLFCKLNSIRALRCYSVTAEILPMKYSKILLYLYINIKLFLGYKWQNFHCNAVTV